MLIDNNTNNVTRLSSADVVNLGFGGQLNVISSAVDTTSPELLGLTLSPNPVDITTGDQLVTFTANFSDDLSGLYSLGIDIAYPSGISLTNGVASARRSLISGSGNNGTVQSTFTIPQFSPAGEYGYSVILVDNTNNVTRLSSADVVNLGFGGQLNVGQSVPEPGNMSLLLISLGGLWAMRRRTVGKSK